MRLAARTLRMLAYTGLVVSVTAHSDQPLAVPETRRIPAPAGNCWVDTDAGDRATTAYRRVRGTTRTLWSINGWYRVAALAADCEHFVTGYDGVNLLPENYSPDTVMLSFYRNGNIIRRVTLAELVTDLSRLKKTVSHWSWGHYIGLEQGTRYRVTTVDHGDILFDMTTGRPLD